MCASSILASDSFHFLHHRQATLVATTVRWVAIAAVAFGCLTRPAIAGDPPGAAIATVFGGGMSLGLPMGMPPKPMTDRMLSTPPENVGAFLHWSAISKKALETPGTTSKNRTLALLSSAEVSSAFDHIAENYRRSLDLASQQDYSAAAAAKVGSKLLETLLTHETAVYAVASETGAKFPVSGALVCDASESAAELSALFEMISKMAGGAIEVSEFDGLKVYRVVAGPPVPFEITVGNRYLVAAIGEGELAETVSRLKSNQPAKWLQKAREQISVERIANFSFVDIQHIAKLIGSSPQSEDPIEAYARELRSMVSASGLDKDGVVIQTHFDVSESMEKSLDSFRRDAALAGSSVPDDAAVSLTLSVQMQAALSSAGETLDHLEPGTTDGMSDFIRKAVDADLRQELIPAIGDRLQLYVSPSEGGQWLTGLTAVLDLEKPDFIRNCLERLEQRLVDAETDIQLRSRSVNGQKLYYFAIAPGARADDFLVMPALCIKDNQLLASTYPQNITALLNRGPTGSRRVEVSPPGTAISFDLDEAAAARLIYPALQMFGPIFTAEVTNDTEGFVQLDFAYLPSLPSITKHLDRAVTHVDLKEGIQVTRRQTMPPSGAGLMGAIALLADVFDRIAVRRAYGDDSMVEPPKAVEEGSDMEDTSTPKPALTDQTVKEAIRDAQELFSQGKYSRAEQQLKSLVDSVPENSAIQLLYAKSIWLQDRNEDSLPFFEKAVQLDATSVDAWFFSALAYNSLQKREKTIEHLTKVIALKPDHKFAHYYRGLAFVALGSRTEAIADFTESIRLNPSFPETYYQRAYLYLGTDDNEAALKDFTKRLSLKPLDTDSLFRRGELYERIGDVEKAIRDYNALLGLKPNEARALRARASVYQEMEKDDLARVDYTRLIELDPIKEDYANRALCWSVENQNEQIVADYTSAIAMDSTYAFAYGWRAMAYQNLKDFAKAKQDYESAIQHGHDDNEITLGNYSWLLAGCPDDAIRNGKLALKHATAACELTDWNESWVIDNVAAGHAEMGNFDQAIKMAEKAIQASASKEEQLDIQTRLDLYRAGKPARFK